MTHQNMTRATSDFVKYPSRIVSINVLKNDKSPGLRHSNSVKMINSSEETNVKILHEICNQISRNNE